jgi:hypothetical protein
VTTLQLLARGCLVLMPLSMFAAITPPQPELALRIAYYQPVKNCRTTMCVTTFGDVVLYDGPLRKRSGLNAETFSLCLESPRESAAIASDLDTVSAVHRFGALAR